MKRNLKSGFSLVELMVVVAIIGVLATVAVPNYVKFTAKAKQTSAKTELAGIYTAEKSFFVEYSTYHSHLPTVGYVPEGITQCATQAAGSGNRIYNVGFTAASGALPGGAGVACGTDTSAASGQLFYGCTTPSAVCTVAAPAGGVAPGATFGARAAGQITAGKDDVWTMNQDNQLSNATNGI